MANEIKLGYKTGQTLTYAVYNPDGTQVTAPGTSLPEIGATGYYTASNASIAAGDVCMISDANGVLFQGEYKPEISATVIDGKINTIDGLIDALTTTLASVDGKIDIIDAIVDLLENYQRRVQTVVPLPVVQETKARIYL